jgi:hypothetical protein
VEVGWNDQVKSNMAKATLSGTMGRQKPNRDMEKSGELSHVANGPPNRFTTSQNIVKKKYCLGLVQRPKGGATANCKPASVLNGRPLSVVGRYVCRSCYSLRV